MQIHGLCYYNVSKNILETFNPNVVNVVFFVGQKNVVLYVDIVQDWVI
jgi:hypothetical protein